MAAVGQTEDRPAERTLFGHPVGLANLFGVELWERFSFYGMLTILGYYLYYSVTDGGLELPKTTATGIVGAYGGLVYLSTVLGGWVADRLLGMERTVFYGGVVVMCGHIALAVLPGLAGVGVGLVLVALGSGALKANASSLLGTLYEKGDAALRRRFHPVLSGHQPRRLHRAADHRPAADPRSASTTASAPPPSGWRSGSRSTWCSGATSASTVVRCRTRCRAAAIGRLRRHRGVAAVVVIAVGARAPAWSTLANLSQVTTGVIVAASVAYFVVMLTSSKVERDRADPGARLHPAVHRQRGVLVAVPADLHGAGGLFRRADELVDLRLDRTVELDRLDRTGLDHSALTAFRHHVDAAGQSRADHAAQVRLRRDRDGAAFLLFLPMAGTTGKAVPALLVVGIMAVFAVSELLLSPIGLSVTTKLAPEAFRAQMMALYFFSVGLGTSMSGVLAGYYDPANEFAYFGIIGAVAIVAGVVVFAISPWISRLMEGVH